MAPLKPILHRLLWAVYPFASPRTLAARVFTTLILGSLVFRTSLLVISLGSERPPILFDSTAEAFGIVASHLIYDLLTALLAAGLVGSLQLGIRRMVAGRALPSWARTGAELATACAVALGFGFAAGSQLRLLMSMHSGFSYDVFAEGAAAISVNDLFGYAKPIDIVLLVIPPAVALALFLLPRRTDRAVLGATSGLVVITCVLACGPFIAGVFGSGPQASFTPAAWNPLAYFTTSSAEHFSNRFGEYETRAKNAPELQQTQAYLEGPAHAAASNSRTVSPPNVTREESGWNVVVFILESAGAAYAFDDQGGRAPMPMPFLHNLAQKGLYLSDHFSTGNTSPRAIFSILSGLYPMPRLSIYSTRPDLRLPSIATRIGSHYDTFLITPSRLESYFPRGLLANAGFQGMHDYYTIPGNRPGTQGGRNELDAADFFLDQVASLSKPFLAIYYSFVPHYPYDDPGPAYRVRPDTSAMLDRYYNNLRLLDAQIERTFAKLEALGELDRTVFLLVGDHGESFGQHVGNLGHSRHSYNENIQVPAVFYQPKIFEPTEVDYPTSHVDLLPTLLDALSIPYEIGSMQGESLLRGVPRRRYIYAVGNENSLVAVSGRGLKTSVNFSKDRCSAFDLALDPGEQRPLDCDAHADQLQASFTFRNFHRRFLEQAAR